MPYWWSVSPVATASVEGKIPRDVVYVRSAGEHLYALDLTTGGRLWSTERGASVGTMAAADGRLFVALGDGALVAQAPPD